LPGVHLGALLALLIVDVGNNAKRSEGNVTSAGATVAGLSLSSIIKMGYAAEPRNKLINTFESARVSRKPAYREHCFAKQPRGRSATAMLARFLRQPHLRPHDGKAARSRLKLRAETGGLWKGDLSAARLQELYGSRRPGRMSALSFCEIASAASTVRLLISSF
jgi:hypothetical protein